MDCQSQTVQTHCIRMSPDRNIKRFMHPAPAPQLYTARTTDLKSNQVRNYHRTYIIQIMDIRAYFLSLLLDRLHTRIPLASFLFIGCSGQSEKRYRQSRILLMLQSIEQIRALLYPSKFLEIIYSRAIRGNIL